MGAKENLPRPIASQGAFQPADLYHPPRVRVPNVGADERLNRPTVSASIPPERQGPRGRA